MQPSAPALGVPPGSKGGKSPAAVPRNKADNLSACAIATRPGRLLTRLSLHGQGVRAIEGLEACHNLQVLVSYFSETICRTIGQSCVLQGRHRSLAIQASRPRQHDCQNTLRPRSRPLLSPVRVR